MNLTNCLRHLRHLAFAVAAALLVASAPAASGCAAINEHDPAIAPTPAPGQPCGPIDVVCYGQGGKIAGCCGEYDTCGGGPDSVGCPANCCCDLGGGGEFSARYPVSPASDAAADAQLAPPAPSSPRRPAHSPTPMRAPYSQAADVFVDSPTLAPRRGF